MKRISLIGLVLVMLLLPVTSLNAGPCGCSPTYMGAPLVSWECVFVNGDLDYSICYYEY